MKKGISLIVLVITIIVMIIIAGAIILSLSNTNVISKANLSKITNDRATLTESTQSRTAEYMAVMDGASPPLLHDTNITFAQSIAPTTAMTSQIPTSPKYTWIFVTTTGEWLLRLIGADIDTAAEAKTALGITETLPSWVRYPTLTVGEETGIIGVPGTIS